MRVQGVINLGVRGVHVRAMGGNGPEANTVAGAWKGKGSRMVEVPERRTIWGPGE